MKTRVKLVFAVLLSFFAAVNVYAGDPPPYKEIDEKERKGLGLELGTIGSLKDNLASLRSKELNFESFTAKVKEDTTSTLLCLERKDIDEAWKVVDLCINLSQNKTLTYLSLDNPNFGSNLESQLCAIKAIKGMFKCNDSITEFSLSCDYNFPLQQIDTLIAGSTWSPSLEYLTLEYLGIIRLSGAPSYFSHSLFKIVMLDLSHNAIDSMGAGDLGEALKKNITITFLDLDNNNISDEGAVKIAEGLILNHTLKTLYLDNNNIQSNGAGEIVNSLRVNRSLTTFSIQGNPLGEDGIGYFCNLFKDRDSSLQTIWFGNIDNRGQGYVRLGNSLAQDTKLTTLGLHSSRLTLAEAMSFWHLLGTNTRITIKLTGSCLTEEVQRQLQTRSGVELRSWFSSKASLHYPSRLEHLD